MPALIVLCGPIRCTANGVAFGRVTDHIRSVAGDGTAMRHDQDGAGRMSRGKSRISPPLKRGLLLAEMDHGSHWPEYFNCWFS